MTTPRTQAAYRLCCEARLAERDGKLKRAAGLYQQAAAQFSLAGKQEQAEACHTNRNRCEHDAKKPIALMLTEGQLAYLKRAMARDKAELEEMAPWDIDGHDEEHEQELESNRQILQVLEAIPTKEAT